MTPVKFVNRKNGFYTRFDREDVSVTTVNQIIAKPMLIDWACRMGAEIERKHHPENDTILRQYFKSISEDAKNRGSNVHNYIEHYHRFKKFPPVKNEFLNGFKEFAKEHTLKPFQIILNKKIDENNRWSDGQTVLSIEIEVHNDQEGYAGTCDFLGLYDNELAIADYKTNDKGTVYSETALQLAAYREALACMVASGEIECKYTWEEVRKAKLLAIGLSSSGTYTPRVFTEPEDGYLFEIFLAFKKGWRWNREYKG